MKTKNNILLFIMGLMFMPSFLFGQGIIISSSANVIANSGYFVVTGNLANSGNLNLQTGSFTMSGNYTNSGTYTQGSGSIVFNGQNQVLSDNGSGTMFTNVFFNGAGGSGNTAVMSSGNFSVSSTGVLTMINATSLNASGHLTLNSDATGSATVTAIPSVASITGNVNVQRYLTGGATTYRGYRLLSSPVYASTVSSNNVYSINYLKNSIFLTGTSTSGGFDNPSAVNPTLYLYRENMTPLYTTFLNSNFKGINNINSSPTYSMDDASNPTINIPVGNGYLCFFRGNRASASFAAETVPAYVPQTVTLSANGTLNQGQIAVKDWFTPSLSTLSYTASSPATIKGYNLVGNPYASSIDWETFQTTTSSIGIYGTSIGPIIYMYDPVSHNYGAYIKGGSGIGTNNASNIITSGQGFFVVATSAATLTFNEGAKTNTQVTNPLLLMGMPKDNLNIQYIRLQLAKDSVNTEDILIRFNDNAPAKYDENFDAQYMMGYGQVNLCSMSSDNIKLAINVLPLPPKSETVRLMVRVNLDGNYKLNLAKITGVPQLFDIWLMDAYKKDSLDMRHNATYNFNVIKNDTNTYGSKRFSMIIRQNPAYAYRLLDFTSTKVIPIAVGARQVQVVWKTENEQNYTNFTVERSADGGQTFNVIGGLQGSGQGVYSLIDKSPVIGRNLYRLKQEDINNNITYSNVVLVLYSEMSNNLVANNISVYPNPATSAINIAISNDAATKHSYTYRITNSLGLIVKQVTSGQPNWQPNISDLMPGSYIIKVLNTSDNSIIGNSKFIKL
ncbi:MAG: T9SS type A sorting domain-containing protein [Mucilaginibacter sp.]